MTLCVCVYLFCLFKAASSAYGVLRPGVQLELQLLAYATATAMWDLSHVFDLHNSSLQCNTTAHGNVGSLTH